MSSEDPLCCDMAFHLLRLLKLWNSDRIKQNALRALKSSAPLYYGQRARRSRSSIEANTLCEITEEELRGVILPLLSKRKRHFQQKDTSKHLEKEISQLKAEVDREFFERLLANWSKIGTEDDIQWQRANRLLTSKLSHVKKPIKALFNNGTRKQFEKTIYDLLKYILRQNELYSVICLFNWSLKQEILLYDLKGWVFITESLLHPCLEKKFRELVEPILVQFSQKTDNEFFQRLLNQESSGKENLRKFFPNLFIPKSSSDSSSQLDNNLVFKFSKNVKEMNSHMDAQEVVFDQKKEKEKNALILLNPIAPTESKKCQADLKEKLEELDRKISSRFKGTVIRGSLEMLELAFGIQSFNDRIEAPIRIYDVLCSYSDELKGLFIKNSYISSKYIKDPSSKDLVIESLYTFWKENSYPPIENHHVNARFQQMKSEKVRSYVTLKRISNVTNPLLKEASWWLVCAPVVHGVSILVQRYFSTEQELTMTDSLVSLCIGRIVYVVFRKNFLG